MKNKNLRTIIEDGGTVAYARETPAPVTEVIEAETERGVAAMPEIKMIDWTRRQVSPEQKARWQFISDGAHSGEQIWFVGMGIFVITSG
jgi:hypothetical protein